MNRCCNILISVLIFGLANTFFSPALASEAGVDSKLNQQPVLQVKHHNKGYSPHIRAYLDAVLKLVLDKSSPQYGAYEIELQTRNLPSDRVIVELERGELIEFIFAPRTGRAFESSEHILRLDFPVFHGLLGLRNLIATQETQAKLSQVDSIDALRTLTVGQGARWIDTMILQHNGMSTVDAYGFDTVFPMLEHHRFDFLSLSILEAQPPMTKSPVASLAYSVNSDLAIVYPHPFYVFVHNAHSELADRLSSGLSLSRADGSLATLFHEYFDFVQPQLVKKNKKLIFLQNPFLSTPENQQFRAMFINEYGDYFKLLN